jgi:hypothetical protein
MRRQSGIMAFVNLQVGEGVNGRIMKREEIPATSEYVIHKTRTKPNATA